MSNIFRKKILASEEKAATSLRKCEVGRSVGSLELSVICTSSEKIRDNALPVVSQKIA